jgi:hypothetical protein
MVQNLNWNTLEQRRSMADVTLMYKVVHHTTGSDRVFQMVTVLGKNEC